MQRLPVHQLVFLVVLILVAGISPVNAINTQHYQNLFSVPRQPSSDFLVLYNDSLDLVVYDPSLGVSERIHEFSNFPTELTEPQSQVIYDHELVRDLIHLTPGYEFVSALRDSGGDIVFIEATCVSNSCPVEFSLKHASVSNDKQTNLLTQGALPPGSFPQLVSWSGSKIFFDTYDYIRDVPFQGIWKYDLSINDLKATSLIAGSYNSRMWVAPDGLTFLTTSLATPSSIDSQKNLFRTQRVIIFDPIMDSITVVADHPTSGEYFVAGWANRTNLELARTNLVPRSVISVPEATSGFQRPMVNDHYGYQWLAWTGSVFHPADDYNGPGSGNADCGTDIKAVADGTVRYYNSGGWGTLVIEHRWKDTTVYSQYGHVASSLVSVGSNVSKGQHIAEMGNVGADTCHLHWEIRESDHPSPTNGSYYTTSVLNNQGNVENYYEDPEWWVDNHGAYSTGDTIKLYRKVNYEEQRYSLGKGFSNEPTGELYSMQIPSNWSVWTYSQDNKGGDKRCWNTSIPNLQDHGWQNRIESIDVKDFNDCPAPPSCPQSGGIILYWNNNYNCNNDRGDSGYRQRTGTGWENISGAFNDQASSVKVPSGWSVRVFAHGDRGQPSQCFTGDISDFGPQGNFPGSNLGINDQVSSFEVFNNATCGGTLTPAIPTLVSPPDGTTIIEGESITLSWNSSSGATEYFGQVTGGPEPFGFGWQSGTTKVIGAQWPGYTYSWRVKAGNGTGGDSGYSGYWKFTVIPKAPSNTTTSELTCNSVKVSWTNNSSSLDGFRIYRNGSEIASVSANITSYINQGLQEQTAYNYTVRAVRNGITSNTSNTASVTTPKCPVTPPPPPVLSNPPNNKIFIEGEPVILSWNSSANATGYYGTVLDGPIPIPFGWQSALEKNLGLLSPGYRYSWKVKARNDGGESGYSAGRTFDVVPATPTNLGATHQLCKANLTWGDASTSEDGYKIFRNGMEVGSTGANAVSYTDQGLQAQTTYNYTVRAFRNDFTSYASNTASVTTTTCETPKPDLVPFAPSGYQYPVVPAAIKATKTSGPLFAGKPVYFDWFFKNIGSGDATGEFQIELWVDGDRKVQYPWKSGMGAGGWNGFTDWGETVLTPGIHTVKLIVDPANQITESNESNNIWEKTFEWKPVNGWWAEFFNNKTLTGDPVLVRDDAAINFDWLSDAPGPGVNADNFSARWTRRFNFEGGNYRFTVKRDDGARLFIDGKSVWSKWEYDRETITFDLAVSAGQHDVVFETYENDGWAQAGLSWTKLEDDACAAPGLITPAAGAVLNNRTITFSWNPVTGCQFNGYTFRVCTSSDVANLANCFIDTGVSGTQITRTITGRDNQDLWWGVRAANAANGANWIARKFRIEVDCSPGADQVALYTGAGFGEQCVTLGIGNYANPTAIGLPNDSISSLKVGQNVRVKLCTNDNGGGTCQLFTADNGDLTGTGLNNSASSAYVEKMPVSDGATLSVNPPTQTASLGGPFCVNLAAAQVTNLGAFEFTLQFPIDMLKAESATIGPFLGSTGRTVVPVNPIINNTTGKVVYGAATLGSAAGPNGGGNLAEVCFTPKKEGNATLTLAKGSLTDVGGKVIPATLTGGSVTISSCYWADLNCDGATTIVDIQLVAARWGTEQGDPQYNPAYDLDDNNKIDIVDIQMVAGQWGWPGRSARRTETPAAPVTFTLDPSQLNLAVGETKQFDLRVSGAENLAAFQTMIDYNPALLRVNGVTLGNFLSSTGRTVVPVGPDIDNNAGAVTFGAFSFGQQAGPGGSGVLATVSVTGLASGSGTLDMNDSSATDPNASSFPVNENDGSFQVGGGGELDAPSINTINNPDGDGNYNVSWSQVSGATGYTLQERFNSGPWTQIYDGPNTSASRTNRSDGSWCYRVLAYDNNSNSNWSSIECTTVSLVVNPPQAPTLYNIGNSAQQNSYWVSWSSVNGATSYELQESYYGGSFTQIYSGPDTSQYIFGQSEGTWCYRVRARNAEGASGWSGSQCTTVGENSGPYKAYVAIIIGQ